MNELPLRAITAGLFFGIWPLMMNRSGLTGNLSSAVFAFGALLVVLPFAFQDIGKVELINVAWVLALGSCLFGGLGLLALNGLLAKASRQQVGSLIVLMIITQIVTPALYQIFQDGGITTKKIIGFIAAIITAVLLV